MNEIKRTIFVEGENGDSVKKILVVTFDGNDMVGATIDGEDVDGSENWSEDQREMERKDRKNELYGPNSKSA